MYKHTLYTIFTAAVMSSVITFSLPYNSAQAHIDAGIGVSLPSSKGYTLAGDVCASASVGSFTMEASAEQKRNKLCITFIISNDTDSEISFDHRSGQSYDAVIFDKKGNELWRWSDGMAFTQALRTESIPVGKSAVFKAEIPKEKWKDIRDKARFVKIYIADTPYSIALRLPEEQIRHDGSHIGIGIGIGTHHDW